MIGGLPGQREGENDRKKIMARGQRSDSQLLVVSSRDSYVEVQRKKDWEREKRY